MYFSFTCKFLVHIFPHFKTSQQNNAFKKKPPGSHTPKNPSMPHALLLWMADQRHPNPFPWLTRNGSNNEVLVDKSWHLISVSYWDYHLLGNRSESLGQWWMEEWTVKVEVFFRLHPLEYELFFAKTHIAGWVLFQHMASIWIFIIIYT